jgi:predicted SprT family Zn-dependent metalloprotease
MSMTRDQLEALLIEDLNKAVYKWNSKYPRYAITRPHLNFTTLKGSTSMYGRAIGDYLIQVNPEWAMALGEDYLETVRHELAHNICARLNQDYENAPLLNGKRERGHGRAWKEVAIIVGARPQRCGTREEYEKVKAAVELPDAYTYRMVCSEGCTPWLFSKRRYNNVTVRKEVYRCPKCHKAIKPR